MQMIGKNCPCDYSEFKTRSCYGNSLMEQFDIINEYR